MQLLSLVLGLEALEDCRIPASTGRALHSFFLDELVGCVDPVFSAALHCTDDEKPFTVSPLQGRFIPVDRGLLGVTRGAQYWVSIYVNGKQVV